MKVKDRYFIDEFGRLWRGREINDEGMSIFWIFSGFKNSSSPVEMWILQRADYLSNYEHDEINMDQVDKAKSLFLQQTQ